MTLRYKVKQASQSLGGETGATPGSANQTLWPYLYSYERVLPRGPTGMICTHHFIYGGFWGGRGPWPFPCPGIVTESVLGLRHAIHKSRLHEPSRHSMTLGTSSLGEILGRNSSPLDSEGFEFCLRDGGVPNEEFNWSAQPIRRPSEAIRDPRFIRGRVYWDLQYILCTVLLRATAATSNKQQSLEQQLLRTTRFDRGGALCRIRRIAQPILGQPPIRCQISSTILRLHDAMDWDGVILSDWCLSSPPTAPTAGRSCVAALCVHNSKVCCTWSCRSHPSCCSTRPWMHQMILSISWWSVPFSRYFRNRNCSRGRRPL